MKAVQAELYAQIDLMIPSVVGHVEKSPSAQSYIVWEFYGNYVVPWEYAEPAETLIESKQKSTYPGTFHNRCSHSNVSPLPEFSC